MCIDPLPEGDSPNTSEAHKTSQEPHLFFNASAYEVITWAQECLAEHSSIGNTKASERFSIHEDFTDENRQKIDRMIRETSLYAYEDWSTFTRYANDPGLQNTIIFLISSRKSTIYQELCRRTGIDPACEAIPQAGDLIDQFQNTQGENLIQFAIIQTRREVVAQALPWAVFLANEENPSFATIEKNLGINIEALNRFATYNREYLEVEDPGGRGLLQTPLIEAIGRGIPRFLHAENQTVNIDTMARTALTTFLYLFSAFDRTHEDGQQKLGLALERLGIPENNTFLRTAMPDLLKLGNTAVISYIAKYFSEMNSTHLAREQN